MPPHRRRAIFAGPLLALPLLVFLGTLSAPSASAQTPDWVELRVASVAVDLQTGAPLALLHADWEMVLPIWIGENEAGAISDALRGVRFPRPLTHDLLVAVVESLGGELEEVRVTEMRESTYFGILRIRTGTGVVEVDSRPSDALALAVRTGARIQVAQGLVDGAPDAEFISLDGERPVVRVRGITASSPTSGDRGVFTLPAGPAVMVLHSDGAVASRGVRRGDLILAVEGEEVDGVRDFLTRVGAVRGDAPLRLRVLREGERREVELPPRRGPGRVG